MVNRHSFGFSSSVTTAKAAAAFAVRTPTLSLFLPFHPSVHLKHCVITTILHTHTNACFCDEHHIVHDALLLMQFRRSCAMCTQTEESKQRQTSSQPTNQLNQLYNNQSNGNGDGT